MFNGWFTSKHAGSIMTPAERASPAESRETHDHTMQTMREALHNQGITDKDIANNTTPVTPLRDRISAPPPPIGPFKEPLKTGANQSIGDAVGTTVSGALLGAALELDN